MPCFLVTYTRRNFHDAAKVDMVCRTIYAETLARAYLAVVRLPRFVAVIKLDVTAPETEAQKAARLAREHNAPVPHGC